MLTSLNREVFKAVGTVVVGLFVIELQRWFRRRRFNNALDTYGTTSTSSISVIAACTDRSLQEDGLQAAFQRLLQGVRIEVVEVQRTERSTTSKVIDAARERMHDAIKGGVEHSPIVILLGLCNAEHAIPGDSAVETHWVSVEDIGTGRRVCTNSSGIRQDWKDCAAKTLARKTSIAAAVEVAWLDLFHDA